MEPEKKSMQVLTTIAALSQWRAYATPPIGFVATMGFLHEGHLSLIRRARAENNTVVASIFVNPTQFGPHEDFQDYPRDLNRDFALLEAAQVDAVFTPAVNEMYPAGASTVVEVAALSNILEGASRPGHFRGVATVVCMLFHVVQPDRAYFGEKDYQQLQVIRRVVQDLHLPVEIVGCPTIRQPDTVALSSRNVYLSLPERDAAVAVPEALFRAQRLYTAGEREVATLQAAVHQRLANEPLIRPDYVAIVHPHTLQPLVVVGLEGGVLCVAVWVGKTRLIDNIRLEGS
jgi:pantoate--beta-alanine ligase